MSIHVNTYIILVHINLYNKYEENNNFKLLLKQLI